MLMSKEIIELIKNEYITSNTPWLLGFSGGKDSTALLSVVYESLMKIKNPLKPVNVVYCDTGVEIPLFSSLVHDTFTSLRSEANKYRVPINPIIVKPNMNDRFFVKVIGRGYATPTNKFRWCTDRLRVKPLNGILNSRNDEYTVLLGVRKGESKERDSVINNHKTNSKYYLKQSGNSRASIFSPIIEYTVDDVWRTILESEYPQSIRKEELKLYYEYLEEEKTTLNDKLNGKGRFGCWTCTVVRKDNAMKSLIDNGHSNLKPLYDYRNWLMIIRDDSGYRCSKRRNGVAGLGPFTLNARKKMLEELLKVQNQSGYSLISDDEIALIKELWKDDIYNPKYSENL